MNYTTRIHFTECTLNDKLIYDVTVRELRVSESERMNTPYNLSISSSPPGKTKGAAIVNL